jgi:t-SNARE complex subunit (syntaxin)
MSDQLMQESEAIKSGINGIRTLVKSLDAQYKQALFAITPDQATKSSQEIQRLTDDTNTAIHKVKSQLDAFKRSPSDGAMRRNIGDSLTQKFADVLRNYQSAQTEYRDKVKTRMSQKVRIVKPDATQDEIEHAIETGEADNLYKSNTLEIHSQAKNALSYIQDRHKEIVQIEASVQELHDLFVDMAILVESHGAILDVVESNVNSAILDTGDGVESMRDANKYQKKGRKKMYIIILIGVIVLIVILLGGILGGLKGRTVDN